MRAQRDVALESAQDLEGALVFLGDLGSVLVVDQDKTRIDPGAADYDHVVLIAAAFSMFNRYVDGLDTTLPPNADSHFQAGATIVSDGYLASTRALLDGR